MPEAEFFIAATAMPLNEQSVPRPEVWSYGTQSAGVYIYAAPTPERYANWELDLPANLDTSGSVTFEVYWGVATVVAGSEAKWRFSHRAVASGEGVNGPYTNEDTADLSAPENTDTDIASTFTRTVTELGWSIGDKVSGVLVRRPITDGTEAGECKVRSIKFTIPVT